MGPSDFGRREQSSLRNLWKGIYLTNASGIHAESIAGIRHRRIAFAYARIEGCDPESAATKWEQTMELQELKGKTMMIVGAGHIGESAGRMAGIRYESHRCQSQR